MSRGERTTGRHEARGIQSAEVKRTGWLQLGCFEAEWVQEVVTRITFDGRSRGVIVQRRFRVVWHSWLGIRDIRTVNLELNATRGNTQSCGIKHIGRRQELDWVIEVKFLYSTTGCDRLLGLGDHHVLWERRQSGAFIGIQVDVLCVHFIIIRRWRVPRDTQFHVVVLECDQWDRGLPVFTEREAKWIESSGARRRAVWTLACVLSHDSWCDVLGEMRCLIINDLTTNQEFDLLDSARPLRLGERSWGTLRDVAVTEEITLAFETNGGDTTRSWGALEHLALHSLGEVRVTTIVRAEEADFGLTDEMRILGTDGDELGNTTRHFIYIEVIFLCGVIT